MKIKNESDAGRSGVIPTSQIDRCTDKSSELSSMSLRFMQVPGVCAVCRSYGNGADDGRQMYL